MEGQEKIAVANHFRSRKEMRQRVWMSTKITQKAMKFSPLLSPFILVRILCSNLLSWQFPSNFVRPFPLVLREGLWQKNWRFFSTLSPAATYIPHLWFYVHSTEKARKWHGSFLNFSKLGKKTGDFILYPSYMHCHSEAYVSWLLTISFFKKEALKPSAGGASIRVKSEKSNPLR